MEMEYYAIYLSIWRPPYHYSYLYVGFPLTVKSICDKERPSVQSSEKKKKRKKMRSLLPLLMLCTSCSCWVSQHRCFSGESVDTGSMNNALIMNPWPCWRENVFRHYSQQGHYSQYIYINIYVHTFALISVLHQPFSLVLLH